MPYLGKKNKKRPTIPKTKVKINQKRIQKEPKQATLWYTQKTLKKQLIFYKIQQTKKYLIILYKNQLSVSPQKQPTTIK